MNYMYLRDEIKKELEGCYNDADVWLKESTANALIQHANKVVFEEDRVVMTFPDSSYMSVKQAGHLCGETEAYWLVIHFGDYNHNPSIPSREKGVIIL